MKQKIYIVDGYNFIYRLFYAVPPFSLRDGTPVNTVFGLAKMILSWFNEDKPDKLFFVLDSPGDNYRHEIYAEYKGTRDKMPDNLRSQEKLIFELLEKFGIDKIALSGYEADDIIGTLVKKLSSDQNNEIYILSGDKDLYQFISTNVSVYDTMKRKIFHRKDAFEKFGVEVEYIVDYLSICGDSSDNIPGIPGFGPKKAQELINKYGSLEQIYENIENISGKTKDILLEQKEIAFLSKKLASIDINVDIGNILIDDYNFTIKNILNDEIIDFFKKLEFKSLIPDSHKKEVRNFNTLKLNIFEIQNQDDLNKLEEDILKNKKVGIGTSGNSSFNFSKINFFLGENTIYSIDPNKISLNEFLKKILYSDILICGFDIKTDLKRIIYQIEKGFINNESQIQKSLF